MQSPRAKIPSPASTWLAPPDKLELEANLVDIWRVNLTLSADVLKILERGLSADESQRAARFHFQSDKDRFIAAHGCLRGVLTRYLPLEPDRISFNTNPYGKPGVSEIPTEQKLEFNLSHSRGFALVAVTQKRQVGVDLEYMRGDISTQEMARRFFSEREVSELLALPPEKRETAFFNCWTRKEAYIKAQGLGLSLPLDSFDVALAPGERAVLRATRPDPQEADHWTLKELEIHPGYAAAVAVQGQDLEFRLWDWNIW